MDSWGKIYKVMYRKVKKEIVLNSLKVDGVVVEDMEGIVKGLLQGLLPDDIGMEAGIHDRTREAIRVNPMDRVGRKNMFTMEELKICVKDMKNKKAPGVDGIKAEILKRCYGRVRERLLRIMNRVRDEGVFPKDWQIGLLKVSLKDESWDLQLVKSYRPVTLLPV